jgi:hypothetical protein
MGLMLSLQMSSPLSILPCLVNHHTPMWGPAPPLESLLAVLLSVFLLLSAIHLIGEAKI